MELRDIEIFLTLAEELHFGRTAERLHITPSRVSHAIKQQERHIGAPLFERTSRTVRLTRLGERFHRELLPAHQQLRRAIDQATAEARGATGTLRAGYTTPWCADLLLRAADEFRGRHAGWTVRIQEIQFSDPYGPLRRGELDVQLSEFHADGPGIVAGPVLFRERRALMVGCAHPLAESDSVSVEDLADIRLITLTYQLPTPMTDLHFPTHTPTGRPVPRGPAYTFWTEVPTLVAAGRGASIVAARAVRYHDRPGVAFVPFRDGPTLDYGVLRHADRQTPFLQEFVDLLGEFADADNGG